VAAPSEGGSNRSASDCSSSDSTKRLWARELWPPHNVAVK
jgi:hypothetical protein